MSDNSKQRIDTSSKGFSIQKRLEDMDFKSANIVKEKLKILQYQMSIICPSAVVRDDSKLAFAWACNNLDPVQWPIDVVALELVKMKYLYECTNYEQVSSYSVMMLVEQMKKNHSDLSDDIIYRHVIRYYLPKLKQFYFHDFRVPQSIGILFNK